MIAALIVVLWSVPLGLGLAFAQDFIVGDRRLWLELQYGSRRRAAFGVLWDAIHAAPILVLLAIAVVVSARLLERTRASAKPLAAMGLGAAAGAIVGGTAAIPLLSITAMGLLFIDTVARRVLGAKK